MTKPTKKKRPDARTALAELAAADHARKPRARKASPKPEATTTMVVPVAMRRRIRRLADDIEEQTGEKMRPAWRVLDLALDALEAARK